MTELLRDLATVFLAWCAGLTVTYGLVESSLFMPVRITVSAAAEHEGNFLETLLYCPFCAGFWAHFGMWLLIYQNIEMAAAGAAVGTAVMLVARACGIELVRSAYASEIEAIVSIRAKHVARESVREEEDDDDE